MRYDLHCHSTYSDGDQDPLALLDLAKEKELSGLSITDHDTIDAYSDELFEEAKSRGIHLIPGVEFSTFFVHGAKNVTIHVLGYGYDIHNGRIKDFCLRHSERRIDRVKMMVQNLRKGGISIDFEKLEGKTHSLGRPHIAQALVKEGYALDEAEAFKKYIGDRAPYFEAGEMIGLGETLRVIKEAGGKAILAHPILVKGRKVLKALLKEPFDGMECYYGRFPRNDIQPYLDMAAERKMLVTGGSDFHGKIKPYIQLGSSFVSKERVERLLEE